LGTGEGPSIQRVSASGSQVPAVPGENDKQGKCAADQAAAEAWATWAERAAILEYDGGMSRAEAERRATDELVVRI
jgi:Fe-S cluster biosynthesis and repair protein YggX